MFQNVSHILNDEVGFLLCAIPREKDMTQATARFFFFFFLLFMLFLSLFSWAQIKFANNLSLFQSRPFRNLQWFSFIYCSVCNQSTIEYKYFRESLSMICVAQFIGATYSGNNLLGYRLSTIDMLYLSHHVDETMFKYQLQ